MSQKEEDVWYFAFGSNMNEKALKRRRVKYVKMNTFYFWFFNENIVPNRLTVQSSMIINSHMILKAFHLLSHHSQQ